jgi:sigma54-dependent transcription regulator
MHLARHCRPAWLLISCFILLSGAAAPGKEFLTAKEIELIQDTQAVDGRVKIYLDAAALRLKSAEDRLAGKEPVVGDPLEFFTPEDMLEGYLGIVKSVMLNIDEAAQKPGPNQALVGKALKSLKSATEKAAVRLPILKKIAEEKMKEDLWNLVSEAIEITEAANDGAEYGLTKHPAPDEKEKKKK